MYKNSSKYAQTTLSKFDIIGSYFVNLFYNEFYTKSVTLKANGTYNNITEAYTSILVSYLDFIKKPEFFKQMVNGIHFYCISTTKYTAMTHKQCVDFMVQEFIPEKLWNALRENQKNKLFHEVMGNCITTFVENIIKEKIHIIIDDHKQPENVIILQDIFLTIILLEKDKIYSKFLNPNNTNTINIEVVKTRIKELVNEKNIILKSFNSLKIHNDKNIEVISNLQSQNKRQQEEIKNLSNTITNLQNKIKQLEYKPIDIKQSLDTKIKDKTPIETVHNTNDVTHKTKQKPAKETQKPVVTNKKKKVDDDLNMLSVNENSDNNSDTELIFDDDDDYYGEE